MVRPTDREMTAIKKYSLLLTILKSMGTPHHAEQHERALRLAGERERGREIAKETARKIAVFLYF